MEPGPEQGIDCACCGKNGTGTYCMHCGETMVQQRLSLSALLKSIPDVFFDVESGLFYSIIHLFKHPGDTIRRYFAGDRKRSYKPLKFILFLGALYAFLYINFDIHGNSGTLYQGLLKDAETGRDTGKKMDLFSDQYTSVLLLFQFPIIAFFTWMVFHKRKYFYGEHLVANAFLIAEVSLYKIILFPLYYLLNGTAWINTLDGLYSLWILAYYTWAYYDWLYFRKTTGGFLVSLIMVIGLMILIAIVTFFLVPILYYCKWKLFGMD